MDGYECLGRTGSPGLYMEAGSSETSLPTYMTTLRYKLAQETISAAVETKTDIIMQDNLLCKIGSHTKVKKIIKR
jgi:hypothetical protein